MRLSSARDLTEWQYAAKALAVLAAWNDVGLLSSLAAGDKDIVDLPGNARAILTTLPILRHTGVVIGDSNRISLSECAQKMFDAGEMPTERALGSISDYAQLPALLKEGGPLKDEFGKSKVTSGGVTHDPEQTARFLNMLYNMSEDAAETSYKWLAPDLVKQGHVLDLGGGHARYARRFADAGFSATLYDLPHVVSYAKEKHGDALQYVGGNFLEAEKLGGKYDLILLSNIVHGESDASNMTLMQMCHAALNPGGRVVIKDMFLNACGKDPIEAAMFSVTMLMYTEGGASPTLDQANHWLKQAGFSEPRIIQLETHQLVCASK
jgi:SAM-dependent methyltransferase